MTTIPNATSEQISRTLGDAIVRIWSQLPQEVQHHIFEEAIASQGADARSQLAIYLHTKHPRTCASIQASAMVEPDSLGG